MKITAWSYLDRRSESGGWIEMPSSTVLTFADPDTYHAAIRAQQVEGVITARGDFRAELTRIDFDRMLMQRGDETLPRVLSVLTHSQRTAILFAVGPSQSAMRMAGVT